MAAKKKSTSKPASNDIEVVLDFTKETKNTYRFDTDDEDAAVTSLYVQKSAFGGSAPEQVTVTVSA